MKTIQGKDDGDKLDRKSEIEQSLYRAVHKIPFLPSDLRYDLTISHQRRFIWFRVAKVGSRTILKHLRASDIHLDVENPFQIHYPVHLYADYFKFAFVRNPWDRLVSCWRDKVVHLNHFKFKDARHKKMQNFKNFVVDFVSKKNVKKCDEHLCLQTAMIDINAINYLGRMETFEDDLNVILRKLGLPEKEVIRLNVTSLKTDYRSYYDDQLAEKVAQIYQKDIQVFGYQF